MEDADTKQHRAFFWTQTVVTLQGESDATSWDTSGYLRCPLSDISFPPLLRSAIKDKSTPWGLFMFHLLNSEHQAWNQHVPLFEVFGMTQPEM